MYQANSERAELLFSQFPTSREAFSEEIQIIRKTQTISPVSEQSESHKTDTSSSAF